MTVELSDEQIRGVLQGISVPPQPQIMVDLQMEQIAPDPDLRAIARLIGQDPGLSGALLKTPRIRRPLGVRFRLPQGQHSRAGRGLTAPTR